MVAIAIDKVHKRFGSLEVMSDVSLDIPSGEFVVFVGPSGCGKSTLLRMIAGLEPISEGQISIGGRVINNVPAAQRDIAMVFQSYALYPHMNVYDNLSFSMKIARKSRAERDTRVKAAAEMLQLTPYLHRRPRELSGGQRQRVAIGRAIVREASVFLFDEPLSNLDAALRVATRVEIAKLKDSLPETTMIYVTHDQIEAMTLADRIVVLNAGRVEQVGSPIDLYLEPRNLFVAGFIGSPAMNFLPCEIVFGPEGAQPKTPAINHLNTRFASTVHSGTQQGTLGIRPEALRISSPEEALFSGTVDLVENLGDTTIIYLLLADGSPVLAKLEGIVSMQKGTTMHVGAAPDNIHCFDSNGQALTRL
ncbi:ABC transporter ATP-binding protein [Devosia algicola]|uniref:ABC transporter ATP-binding protein n=1 Tax=Devosia algicola TaxID=3026418 RepID=A0ABY7YJN9_9HYPH|nr:ABC transporter ATP-binding protein [Devosia algicola]WDR01505.1 ABC transporter ATP-binding protein [Devosia algicola]